MRVDAERAADDLAEALDALGEALEVYADRYRSLRSYARSARLSIDAPPESRARFAANVGARRVDRESLDYYLGRYVREISALRRAVYREDPSEREAHEAERDALRRMREDLGAIFFGDEPGGPR